jgi:hypothetical protein
LYNPKYSNQYTFNNPVPLIKRQKSLTEAVLMSFGRYGLDGSNP